MRSPNAKTLLATGLATALLGNAVASTMCRTDGSSASFKWDYSNADYVLVTSNGCPDHAFENSVGQNPNSATVKNWSFRLPKKPIIRDNSRGYNVKVIQSQGPVGISLSGAPIFGPATSQQSDAYGVYAGQRIALYGDAGADPDQHGELDTFDYCGGHSTPDGCYHYHVDPYCIRKSGETPGKLHSALLGFMSDGIPLYGIYNDYGQIPTDLDTCGGHASDSGADGLYHYHMRSVPGPFPQEEGLDKYDPTYFPYTPTCLMGCIYDETSNSNKVQQETYSTCSRSGTKSSSGMLENYRYTPLDYDYSLSIPYDPVTDSTTADARFSWLPSSGTLIYGAITVGAVALIAGAVLFVRRRLPTPQPEDYQQLPNFSVQAEEE